MRSWIVSILTLALLVLAPATNHATACTKSEASACQKEQQGSEHSFSKMHRASYPLSNSEQFDTTDIEKNQQPLRTPAEYNGFRCRRAHNFSADIKEIITHLSALDTLLTLKQSKIHHSKQASNYSQTTCDYYVFALRHIRI